MINGIDLRLQLHFKIYQFKTDVCLSQYEIQNYVHNRANFV